MFSEDARTSHNDGALRASIALAVGAGLLPGDAERWRKVVQLEELSLAVGLRRNTLRNLYYRDDPRFLKELDGFRNGNTTYLTSNLQAHLDTGHSVVWLRPLGEVIAARERIQDALATVEEADRVLRKQIEPDRTLRLATGAVAVELMARALSFFEGQARWELLNRCETIFLNALAPLGFELDTEPDVADAFSRFWENRATECGMVWNRVWDDPSRPAPVSFDVVDTAICELDRALSWLDGQHDPAVEQRIGQLQIDKAKWLAKIGHFTTACDLISGLEGVPGVAVEQARSHILALQALLSGDFKTAKRHAGNLVELTECEEGHSYVSVGPKLLLHQIDLVAGRNAKPPAEVQEFLETCPAVVSEHVDLARYRQRLGRSDTKSQWSAAVAAE